MGRALASLTLTLTLTLALTTTDVQGGPMRGPAAARAIAAAPSAAYPTATATVPSLTPAWDRFLSAPDLWTTSRTPPFSMLVRRAVWRVLDGDPTTAAANPMIDYLIWRRGLNPFRFDHYHPLLGPRLGRLPTPQPQAIDPPTLAPLTALPIAPAPPPVWPLAPLTTPPPQVPEPGGFVLILLVSAWGVWKRSEAVSRAG